MNSPSRQIISQGTWEKANDVDTKLNILFDLSWDTRERVKKLENKKILHGTVSFLGGVVGGFTAVLGRWLFWDAKP